MANDDLEKAAVCFRNAIQIDDRVNSFILPLPDCRIFSFFKKANEWWCYSTPSL